MGVQGTMQGAVWLCEMGEECLKKKRENLQFNYTIYRKQNYWTIKLTGLLV